MSKRRLAMNEKGELTYCSAPIDKIGQGRCNHIAHHEEGQSIEEFVKEAEQVKNKQDNYEKEFGILPKLENSSKERKNVLPKLESLPKGKKKTKLPGLSQEEYKEEYGVLPESKNPKGSLAEAAEIAMEFHDRKFNETQIKIVETFDIEEIRKQDRKARHHEKEFNRIKKYGIKPSEADDYRKIKEDEEKAKNFKLPPLD